MDACVFCAIVTGLARADIVHSDETVVVLAPLGPANPGHLLVIPREHADDIWSVPPADAHRLMDTVLWIAQVVREGLRPDGLNVITSAGAAATQTVFHLHIHVVPRWHGDGFGDIWPSTPRVPESTVATALASIRRIAAQSRHEIGRDDEDGDHEQHSVEPGNRE